MSATTWRVAPGTSAAQLAATIVFADTGPANARVRLYSTTRPTAPGDHSDTPMATVVLAKPCATVVDGVLTLHPLDTDGTLVMSTGLPRWGELVNGAGALVVDGSVTDEASGGDFTVAGGITPPGETSPLLQAGGLVLLGATALT
jgi:hypothetical protein